jgi:hypothetical protein
VRDSQSDQSSAARPAGRAALESPDPLRPAGPRRSLSPGVRP